MSAIHRKLSKAEVLKRGAALAQARAASAPSPIPTGPVQKHFSEAGEKKGWKPDDYVALALAALIAVFAFASLLAGYWRGQ